MLRAYRRARAPAEAEHDALWARIEASLDEGATGSGLEPLPATRPVAIGPVIAVVVAVAAVVVGAIALRPGRVGDASARRAPTQAVHETGSREPAVASSERGSVQAPVDGAPPVPAAAVVREPGHGRTPRETPSAREPLAPASAASEGATPEPSDGLLAEMALVHEARQALRGDRPARALELLDAHARAFPAGQMREDRQVLRIEALCATGKAPQARAEAALFLRAFPGSAHAQRVRASCAER